MAEFGTREIVYHHVTIITVVTALMWTTGLVLTMMQLLTHHQTGTLGLLVAGVAGVINIKGFFREQYRREVEAFEIGRAASVIPLRR